MKKPASVNRPIDLVQVEHSCPTLTQALNRYIVKIVKTFGGQQSVIGSRLPFNTLNIYHQFKLRQYKIQDDDDDAVYIIRANPQSQFDTVVVIDKDEAEATGLQGQRDNYIIIFSYLSRF